MNKKWLLILERNLFVLGAFECIQECRRFRAIGDTESADFMLLCAAINRRHAASIKRVY